jgi:hypothetical protein
MATSKNENDVRFATMGAAMALGLVLGGLVGLLIDNMIIFAGGGMILGLAIGTAIESRQTRE